MFEPERMRGVELLDDPSVAEAERVRSHRDIVRSNVVFGGRRAVLAAILPVLESARQHRDALTLLDVGTGLADLPHQARMLAARMDLDVHTIGLDGAPSLLDAARERLSSAVAGDAFALPLATASVDIVLCSQLLHHFEWDDAVRVIAELDRVARRAVIVSDLRRSRVAAAGFWAASFPLGFHRITRHDGTVSVLRGFTDGELASLVRAATGVAADVRRRLGFRLTASWRPLRSIESE